VKCRHSPDPPLPLRVIDVGPPGDYQDSLFLSVSHGRTGKYVTLSYRWGLTPNFKTKRRNLARRVTGFSFTGLPRTLRDAVTVTRRLGIRYLWIDAVCIIQDSKTDWEEQSAKMSQIYGDAWLNIAANGSANSNSGFLGKRNIQQIRSCEHPSLFGSSGPKRAICYHIPEPEKALAGDVVETRGWCLQERLLSKRIIHFGPHEVSWECNEMKAWEREPGSFRPRSWKDRYWFSGEYDEWDVMRSYFQESAFLSSQGKSLNPGWIRTPFVNVWDKICGIFAAQAWIYPGAYGIPLLFPEDTHPELHPAFRGWYKLVEEYSERVVSVPSDKLPAISGLAAIYQHRLGGNSAYIAGLWADDLPTGLAWFRVKINRHWGERSL
jgi:hypothetical protein